MTPTEKHRETARKIVATYFKGSAAYDDSGLVADLTAALANAEREGMKRAADELETALEKRKAEKKKAGNDYISSSIGFIRHLIARAEGGEG